mgnify:FL=1
MRASERPTYVAKLGRQRGQEIVVELQPHQRGDRPKLIGKLLDTIAREIELFEHSKVRDLRWNGGDVVVGEEESLERRTEAADGEREVR